MKRQRNLLCLLARVLLWVVVAHLGSARACVASPSQASQAVASFYRRHLATDMSFTEKTLKAKRRYLTPAFYRLLRYELRRPVPKDETPYIEGDPFTDSQEGPERFGISSVRQAGSRARVGVFFDWVERGKTVSHRICHVKLSKRWGAWRIADIVGSDGQSLLVQLKALKRKDLASRRQ